MLEEARRPARRLHEGPPARLPKADPAGPQRAVAIAERGLIAFMKIRQTGIGLALVAAGSLAVLWLTDISARRSGRVGLEPHSRRGRRMDAARAWLVLRGRRRRTVSSGWPRSERFAWPQAGRCGIGGLAGGTVPRGLRLALGRAGEPRPHRNTPWASRAGSSITTAHEGYFEQARYVMRDVPSYLAGYEKRMAQGDYLHLGTHPPGLILFHRACINLCSGSPGLARPAACEPSRPRFATRWT